MMNSICRILLLVVLSAGNLAAQSNFFISGNLPAEMSGNIKLKWDKTFLHRSYEFNGTTIIDSHFALKNNLERNYILQLTSSYFTIPIYAEAGEELELKIKGTSTPIGYSFSGKGSEQNNFLHDFLSRFKDDFNDSLNQVQMLNSTVDAFESALFSKRKAQMEFFKSSSDFKNFSPEFNKFIENEINYHYWKELLAFPIVNANKDSKILTVNELPPVMLENFDKVKLNNDSAMISDSYQDFLKYFVAYSASKSNSFKKFPSMAESADRKSSVAKEKLDTKTFIYWISRYTIDECNNLKPSSVKKLMATLNETEDNSKTYWIVVNDLCKERANQPDNPIVQTPGTPIKMNGAEAGLKDIKGKSVTFESLKGKVVYIDFWASWCGPCRKMMPFSKSMHEQLTEKQKKDIAFLYISIDQDSAAWRKAINDLGIEGVQYISPGNWQSKACQYFQIGSIPRYMIMNKKGEIVDFNARRPADSAVLQQLIGLTLE